MIMANRPKKWSVPAIIIMSLLGIGVIYGVLTDMRSFLIPIIVFGLIYVLYKFPPDRWRSRSGSASPQVRPGNRSQPAKRPKSQRTPFRVIEGGKEDDDLPKYH